MIKSKPKPLAAYFFSDDEQMKKEFVQNISAGGVVFNDTIVHVIFSSWNPVIHLYIYIAILCHCNAPSVLTTAYTYSYSLHFIICIGDLNSLGNHAAYEFYRLQFPPYPLEELERVEWDRTMVNFLLMPLATRKQFFTEALMEIQQQGIHRTQQKSKNY